MTSVYVYNIICYLKYAETFLHMPRQQPLVNGTCGDDNAHLEEAETIPYVSCNLCTAACHVNLNCEPHFSGIE